MKAMILAAGLGTRLRPYSRHTPKALFTIDEQPVLAMLIEKLRRSGCHAIIINTHHHHQLIEDFIDKGNFGLPVQTRHEAEILGTGGGIRNVADFWKDEPLLVINADIVTDIDPAAVYAFHKTHPHPVTMVMHDHAQFNSVSVNADGMVTGFSPAPEASAQRTLAFTGIHVLARRVLDYLPEQGPAHIIDAYRELIAAGRGIIAHEVQGHRWYDIGTPENYLAAVYDHMAPLAFERAFGKGPDTPIEKASIQGDGSDRHWYRLTHGGQTLVMAAHGIRPSPDIQEVDAYVAIGTHLADRGLAVPRIHARDRHAGLVFLQDVGETHLQTAISIEDIEQTRSWYQRVIDQWVPMAMVGANGFDTRWCHQTPHFDRRVVLDNECRYFMEAFVQGDLQWNTSYAELKSEFEQLAQLVMESEIQGFVHRDFQSRNIMIHEDRIYFIDFQGGRLGPIQYDLASLLIDPYAALPEPLQLSLLEYATEKLRQHTDLDRDKFRTGYAACALSRNLQILGAYAYLSRVKGKTRFRTYIPVAARSLVRNLSCLPGPSLPKLKKLSERVASHLKL